MKDWSKNEIRSYISKKEKNIKLWKKLGKNPTLDIGSGSGEFARAVGATMFDTDNFAGSEVVVGSAEKLPFPDESFETVTMWQVLEHLENPWQAIREVRRVLRRGGVFLFSVPNVFSLRNKIGFLFKDEMFRYNPTNDHRFVYTRWLFKFLFKDFTKVREGYLGGSRNKWFAKIYWACMRK